MADSLITNRPVGAALGDWFRRPSVPFPPSPYPEPTLSPGLAQVMRSRAEIIGAPTTSSAPPSAPIVAPQVMSPEPWSLPGYLPAEVKGRDTPAQTSKRGAGALPAVSYGGVPAGGLTIDQALKLLSVNKPLSPGEQAQNALLGRAAQQRGQIENYLGTLKPGTPAYQQAAQDADQRTRNNLLDVLGGNLFQNYLAGRTVGQ